MKILLILLLILLSGCGTYVFDGPPDSWYEEREKEVEQCYQAYWNEISELEDNNINLIKKFAPVGGSDYIIKYEGDNYKVNCYLNNYSLDVDCNCYTYEKHTIIDTESAERIDDKLIDYQVFNLK